MNGRQRLTPNRCASWRVEAADAGFAAKSTIRGPRAAIATAILFTATACDAQGAPPATEAVPLPKAEIGAEYQPCEQCPTFVRVPDAPDSLRPIQYVGKYELTWNDFFAAFDDGSCELPKRWGWGRENPPILEDDPLFDSLRLNWAITTLGVAEIECYQEWFERKTGLRPELPSYLEWEWFARSGIADRVFPWGDEPDGTRGALDTALIRERLGEAQSQIDLPPRIRKVAIGAEVGLFQPTEWGLHDVLGNAPELTNDIIEASNVERFNEILGAKLVAGSNRNRIMKGFRLSSRTEYWKRGIADNSFVLETPVGFSASVAVRFVLVGAE